MRGRNMLLVSEAIMTIDLKDVTAHAGLSMPQSHFFGKPLMMFSTVDSYLDPTAIAAPPPSPIGDFLYATLLMPRLADPRLNMSRPLILILQPSCLLTLPASPIGHPPTQLQPLI